MITRRLYYDDSYLREFRAEAVSVEGRRVLLDATAFYPASGGQPFDIGTIGGAAVIEVAEEEDGRLVHLVDGDVAPGAVECAIDWTRRFDHMQQHTGQHILSAVFVGRFGMPTLSFHMGKDVSTIELGAAALTPEQVVEAERAANAVIFEGRPVTVSYHDASEDLGLRKESQRTGTLRVVSIAGLDRSACGGTHVRNTAEVGAILLRKLDKVRGNVRVEFVCGGRAVARARADYDALSRAARVFSAPVDDVDGLVAAQAQRLMAAEKELRRLNAEAAQREGRERCTAASRNERGWAVEVRRTAGAMSEEHRLRACAFTEMGAGVWVELFTAPAAVLVAASPATGLNAGVALKPLLAAAGGRGGGSAALAQGSVPDAALDGLEAELRRLVA